MITRTTSSTRKSTSLRPSFRPFMSGLLGNDSQINRRISSKTNPFSERIQGSHGTNFGLWGRTVLCRVLPPVLTQRRDRHTLTNETDILSVPWTWSGVRNSSDPILCTSIITPKLTGPFHESCYGRKECRHWNVYNKTLQEKDQTRDLKMGSCRRTLNGERTERILCRCLGVGSSYISRREETCKINN